MPTRRDVTAIEAILAIVIGCLLFASGVHTGGRVAQIHEEEKVAIATGMRQLETLGSESTIPLVMEGGVWRVQAILNGYAGTFLVDTGSTVTVVSPAFAASMGLKGSGRALSLEALSGVTQGEIAVVDSVRLGGMEFRGVTAVIHNPGTGLDGIVGNDLLTQFAIAINPADKTLSFRKN